MQKVMVSKFSSPQSQRSYDSAPTWIKIPTPSF